MSELGKYWVIAAILIIALVVGLSYQAYKNHGVLPEKAFSKQVDNAKSIKQESTPQKTTPQQQ
jgi:uncharacterized membrane protein